MADVEVTEEVAVVKVMTKAAAAKLTRQIREAVESVPDLLLQAWEGQAHQALGYETWEQYVTTEFRVTREDSYKKIRKAEMARELAEVAGGPVNVSERAVSAFGKNRDEVLAKVREAVEQAGGDRVEAARVTLEAEAAVYRARHTGKGPRPAGTDGVRPSVPQWLKGIWSDVERASAHRGESPFDFVVKIVSAVISEMDLPAPEPVEKPARGRRPRQTSGRNGADAQEADRQEAAPSHDPFIS